MTWFTRAASLTAGLALAVVSTPLLATPAHAAPTNLVEGFDDLATLPAKGWKIQNNSTPVGSISWFQGTHTTATPTPGPFNSFNGAPNSYAGVNFNSTGSTGTISNWLISPVIEDLSSGDVLTFHTRKPTIGPGQTDFPDRLEVRMSTNGAACNPGSGVGAVGDFTTPLVTVNPTLVAGVYPQVWTQYSVTIKDVAPTSGCFAFRYHVNGAGSLGTNSDYIGVDQVTWTHHPDPVVPDTAITSSPSAPTASPAVSFTGTPAYAVTGYECSVDGATFTACTSPFEPVGLADGAHSLQVRAVASTGALDPTPAHTTFTVDTTAPQVGITTPTGVLTTAEAEVTFSTDTPDATTQCRLDEGAWNDCTSPWALTGLTDGDHSVDVRATDSAHNTGSANHAFVVDTTAPEVTLTVPTDVVTTRTAEARFTTDDPDATTECRLDSGDDTDWAPCTSPFPLTNLADGTHTVEVRATDAVGNVGTVASGTFSVQVPAAPVTPVTPVTPENPGSRPNPTPGHGSVTVTVKKKVRSGKKVVVRVTGLTTGQKVTVRIAGKRWTGTATSGQTLVLRAKAPRVNRTKRVKVKVTGAATRTIRVKVRSARR